MNRIYFPTKCLPEQYVINKLKIFYFTSTYKKLINLLSSS